MKKSKSAGAKRGGGRNLSKSPARTSSSGGGRRAHARSDLSERSNSKRKQRNAGFRDTIRHSDENWGETRQGPKRPVDRRSNHDQGRDRVSFQREPAEASSLERRRGGSGRRAGDKRGYGSTTQGAHAFRPGAPTQGRYGRFEERSGEGRNKGGNRGFAALPAALRRPSFQPLVRDEDDEPTPRTLPRPPAAHTGSGQVVEGRVEIHPDGFGFLIAKDPTLPNVYIGEDSLKHVMHRDEVRARVDQAFEGGSRLRGTVLEILKRHQREFIGLARPYKGGLLVVPTEARDRKHAFKADITRSPHLEDLKSGTPVLCRILTYPSNTPGTVEVVDKVEDPLAPHNDTLRVLIEASWPREFSRPAIAEAEKRALSWKQELSGTRRKDITHLPLVTIDGRDARDFDDAVCAVREGNSIRLWVAIADVSHFVRPGSPLDREAFERSTSVYFPDFVVPMLPEILSNGVCSLNPFEERACLVCEMVVDSRGQISDYEFYEGLMISKRRLTYEQMQAFADEEPWAVNELASLREPLTQLIEIYRRLREARTRRGSIDLDLPEAQVVLSREGEVLDIQARTRLDAHRLIEECMLVANECAANFLYEAGGGAVYRIHEVPDPRRVEDLKKFLRLAGILETAAPKRGRAALEPDEAFSKPQHFSDLLARIKRDFEPGDPVARAAQTLVLRTMKQARYAPVRAGHFALASRDYTHFTSPIRRYPDLMVHRLIKETLGYEVYIKPGVDLEANCLHCSDRERLAMDAERKLIDIKKCRFMEAFLGETFEGWITGLTEKGAFCQIAGHFVDGLITQATLHSRARLHYESERMAYVGPGKLKLELGTRVKVLLAAVDVFARKIDFDLLEIEGEPLGAGATKSTARG